VNLQDHKVLLSGSGRNGTISQKKTLTRFQAINDSLKDTWEGQLGTLYGQYEYSTCSFSFSFVQVCVMTWGISARAFWS
jgi:hypothetical protein